MDIVNWKKFCNTSDTKHLDQLSDIAKQTIKSYLDKNVKNKKLQDILKLYFKEKIKKFKDTYTITFGDQAENNPGMQKIGTLSDKGFTCKELKQLHEKFKNEGYKMELINL